jgi:LmbE family N-acetylglucosaminyl deacetylase
VGDAVVIEIAGAGTGEDEWAPFLAGLDLPSFTPAPLGTSGLVVVSPHPDDEILGLGGLLSMLDRRITLVAVTDGEASHPGSTVYRPQQLAQLRRGETRAALARLGVEADIVYCGQPDGGIDEDALVDELGRQLTADHWCFVSWRGDGHPDHEVVGRAAGRAVAAAGSRLVEYPIWAWHWAGPGDPRVPWQRARSIALTPETTRAKEAAIATFRTQIHPLGPDPADAAVLPPHVLARFRRPFEVVFV